MSEQTERDIAEALAAATPGPWAPCTWDPMERPHVIAMDKQTGTYCDGKADLPLTDKDAYLIAMSKDWLQYCLEEITRLRETLQDTRKDALDMAETNVTLSGKLIELQNLNKTAKTVIQEMDEQVQQLIQERDAYRTALEFYADFKNYIGRLQPKSTPGLDFASEVQLDGGGRANRIISQYRKVDEP